MCIGWMGMFYVSKLKPSKFPSIIAIEKLSSIFNFFFKKKGKKKKKKSSIYSSSLAQPKTSHKIKKFKRKKRQA
jgi:hypothetical protein